MPPVSNPNAFSQNFRLFTKNIQNKTLTKLSLKLKHPSFVTSKSSHRPQNWKISHRKFPPDKNRQGSFQKPAFLDISLVVLDEVALIGLKSFNLRINLVGVWFAIFFFINKLKFWKGKEKNSNPTPNLSLSLAKIPQANNSNPAHPFCQSIHKLI